MQEAVFLRGEPASPARYHYSFWSKAISADFIFSVLTIPTNDYYLEYC